MAKYRLIRIAIKKATRDGETEMLLLTNLSKSAANAKQVAELYRRRWEIETMFQKLERHLNSEVNSLGYPKAALFAFCVALIAYNALAVVAAALRRIHGDDVIAQKVSGFYIAGEVTRGYEAVMIAIRPKEWARLRQLSDADHRDLLLKIAATVDLSKYKKHVRGPKKPPGARTLGLGKPHVSTARLLVTRNETLKELVPYPSVCPPSQNGPSRWLLLCFMKTAKDPHPNEKEQEARGSPIACVTDLEYHG